MKKLFFVVLAAVAISFSSIAAVNAGWFDSAVTMSWTTRDSDVKYKLETHGFDVRVYEWTPAFSDDVRCVFVAGNENATGTACYSVK